MLKTIKIGLSALAGIVILSGCAYDGYYRPYAYYGYGPYGYGYYNRYAYYGYYRPYAYNGYWVNRYYTVGGARYDCLSRYNAVFCG